MRGSYFVPVDPEDLDIPNKHKTLTRPGLRTKIRVSLRGGRASSGFCRGDHFAYAALRIACEERPDVLSHPRPADLPRDAVRVFRRGELEDQDQMPLGHFCDPSRERARIDDTLHPLRRCPHGPIRHRIAEVKMVDHHVHKVDLIGSVLSLQFRFAAASCT